jgi:glycosyltransferase involved in cell wall biosynthesis
VVIPTLGGDSLAGTIDQLNRGTVVPGEILICIPDEFVIRVAKLTQPNVRVLRTTVRGQVAQRIEGFKAAKTEYVLQLDDDVALEPHCLERLIAAVETLEGNCSVAAALRHTATDTSVYTRGSKGLLGTFYYRLLNGARGYAPGTITAAGTEIGLDPQSSTRKLHEVEWLPGGCVLHSRRNLVIENYYPHPGKAYSEDLYQSRCLARNGVRMMIAGDAIAWIEVPTNEHIPFRRWMRDLRDDYRARRHYISEGSGSAWRMHAYYAVRLLRQLGSRFLSPIRQ